MTFAFDAFVTFAGFTRSGAAFALGDGTVRFEDGASVAAHDGAILCAAVHPSGQGLVTGGDDGRVVWSKPDGRTAVTAEVKGRWIDCLAASAESGLIAFAAGKALMVRDVADPAFERTFIHERSVADVAFDAKGRRLAAATYGGVAVWYARIAEQKPMFLKWAGSHILARFSTDGRFLMSSMQENQLHGWRLADSKNLRMGGYPSKVKSMTFLAKGALMATSGAPAGIVWPFTGSDGPMGKEAAEINVDQSAMVAMTAGSPERAILACGLDDGRVWVTDLRSPGVMTTLKAEKGPPITALAMSVKADRLAWGDEEGGGGVFDVGPY